MDSCPPTVRGGRAILIFRIFVDERSRGQGATEPAALLSIQLVPNPRRGSMCVEDDRGGT